jgi:hypothetical protein
VIGVSKIFVVTEIVAGDMMAAVDGVSGIMMSCNSVPVKRMSGESVRAKSVAHMDRAVGREAVEAMKAAKAVHAAASHMKTTASHMKATASHMKAAAASAAKVNAAFCHCRDIGRKAERANRNAGR